jgi:beta-mannanase
VIDAQAARLKAFGKPLFMDFNQEPESNVNDRSYGSAADYAAAFRHIVKRFRAEGATNVTWVWNVTGDSEDYGLYADGLYPGDDVVDWIAWAPYNWYRCHDNSWASFAETVKPFYAWLQANGHAYKPYMLAEYGTRESDTDPLAKGRWFRDELTTVKAGTFPNLKALVYFDSHAGGCEDWRIDTSTASLDGFRRLANDPYLRP